MKNEMTQAADAAAAQIAPQHAREITPATPDSQADVLLNAVHQAIAAGKDADTIEKLLAMSERIMDRKAEELYWSAFHQARTEMPAIQARGKNTSTGSSYELMEDVLQKIEPVYTRHGFSMTFWGDASPFPEHRRLMCKVAHTGGHSETYHTDMPLDLTGAKGTQNKTRVHASGSADTYAQRYLTRLVWNLRIVKNPLDDDGNAGGAVELITENQAANIEALFEEVGGDKSKFLQPYGCDDFNTMPQKFFKRAVARLEKKRAQS